jgi:hypothetical protein
MVTPFRHSSPSDGMTIVRCDASTGGGAFLAYNARADGLVIRDCTAEHGGGVALKYKYKYIGLASYSIVSGSELVHCTRHWRLSACVLRNECDCGWSIPQLQCRAERRCCVSARVFDCSWWSVDIQSWNRTCDRRRRVGKWSELVVRRSNQ